MPEIEKIAEVLHQPMDPYHHQFDNLPLANILERQRLINSAVDINTQVLTDSIGTAGTLANRLAQSLENDGSLITIAIDEALHNIAEHTDGTTIISGVPVSFVRMLGEERDKLALISDEASALRLRVPATPSTTALFENETVVLQDSDTISWNVVSANTIEATMAFPSSAAHQHYYDRTPSRQNTGGSDYQNWKTTTVSTAYVSGTLRVYVNGIRLSETASVYVPPVSGPDGTWSLTNVASVTPSSGLFSLNRNLDASDVIRIDFDISLV